MSYKCKNCGQLFVEKVDYCDCGNNVFIEIFDYNDNANDNANDTEQVDSYDDEYNDYYEPQEEKNVEYSDVEDYRKKSVSSMIVALVFLFISVALSSFVLFKAISLFGSSDNKKDSEKKQEVSLAIPDIDSFWKNENNKVEENNTNSVKVEEISAIAPVLAVEPKNTNGVNVKKAEKPVQNNVSKNTEKPKNISKPSTPKVVKENTVASKDIVSEPKKVDVKKSENASVKTENTDSVKEMQAYKVELRQRLFNYFPILNVSGNGSATIAFSLAENGKLLNRRFVVQSDNKSLNDAMYHMLMRTPEFKNPPSSYKGEDIILKMEFNNGSYAFSYVN